MLWRRSAVLAAAGVLCLLGASPARAQTGETFSTPEEFFAARVQPNLGYCRSCHVPGGIADVPAGRRYQLSSDPGEDYSKVQAAWTALGKGVETNLLLVMPSDPNRSHTGGKPWPPSSDAYQAMRTLLACFQNPDGCLRGATGGGSGGEQWPLLGNPGKHFFVNELCDGQPDATPIDWTQDPRRLMSGANIDNDAYAVYFNDPFEICRTEDLFKNQARQNELRVAQGKAPIYSAKRDPATCGEWRAAVKSGHDWINGVPTTGGIVPASSWNDLWKLWGLSARPADFEAQITERYGNPPTPAEVRNPYPLPGEDPAATNGGSGRLPLGWVQDKDAGGKYNGMLGINCFICHSAQIGAGEIASRDANGNSASYGGNPTGSFMGLTNTNQDFGLQIIDLLNSTAGGLPLLTLPTNVNATRGTHNADGDIEVIVAIRDFDTLEITHALVDPLHASFGDQDPPAWWWLHNKARYLWFGGHSTDSARGNMYFGSVNLFSGEYNKSREGIFEDVHQWTLTIEAPSYPGPIDTALAEQGAILFHEKELWAGGANADIPRPNGKGSCAGCHGVYSPRYAHDPRFLPDPRMIGENSYTVPLEIVGTDPAQAAGWAKEVRPHVSTFWWAYPDAVAGYKLPEEKDPLTEFLDDYAVTDGMSGANLADHLVRSGDGTGSLQPANDALATSPLMRAASGVPGLPLGAALGRVKGSCAFEEKTVGYVAPPLHGVWASAPYFHNGSVPTVWDVLKPADRPKVWRRQLTPRGITSGPDRGFEHELGAGYDFEKLGWKHDVLACGDLGQGVPYYTCQPAQDLPPELGWLKDAAVGGGQLWPFYGQIPPIGQQGVEDRKIFDTNLYSKKNTGHEWTKVLSDAERRALIEYLKTL